MNKKRTAFLNHFIDMAESLTRSLTRSFPQYLIQIKAQLLQKDVNDIKFLCTDFHFQETDSILELFQQFRQQGLISEYNVNFLMELFYLIHRKDLMSLTRTKRYIGTWHQYDFGPYKYKTSRYRRLLHKLGDFTSRSDFQEIKLSVNHYMTYAELECVHNVKDLFLILEKRALLGENNLKVLYDLAPNSIWKSKLDDYCRVGEHTTPNTNTASTAKNIAIVEQNNTTAIPDTNDDSDETNEDCIICMENKVSSAFVPCGHMNVCDQCYPKLPTPTCPSCKQPIENHMKIFT